MATRTEQLARLELLEKMRDSGVSSTTVDGVQTTFRNATDLSNAIARLKRDLGITRKQPRNLNPFMGHR